MKEIKLLKILINVFYYTVLVASIVVVLFVLVQILFFNGVGFFMDSDSYVILNEEVSRVTTWKDYVFVASGLIAMVIFVLSVYHLRSATMKLVNGDVYHRSVSQHLRIAGQLITFYVLFKAVLGFLKSIVYTKEFSVGFDFDGYGSSMFLIILGLFFMLIARVLDHSRELKLENDLTI